MGFWIEPVRAFRHTKITLKSSEQVELRSYIPPQIPGLTVPTEPSRLRRKLGHTFHCAHTEGPWLFSQTLQLYSNLLPENWPPHGNQTIECLLTITTARTEHPSIPFCPTVLTSVIMKSLDTITLQHRSKLSCNVS